MTDDERCYRRLLLSVILSIKWAARYIQTSESLSCRSRASQSLLTEAIFGKARYFIWIAYLPK